MKAKRVKSFKDIEYPLIALDSRRNTIGELMDLLEEIYSYAVDLSEYELIEIIKKLKVVKSRLTLV